MLSKDPLTNALFFAFILIALLILFLGCAGAPKLRENSIDPVLANDATIIIEGCGHQPIVGYTYCRKYENQLTIDALYFHFPPFECGDATSCVYVKIFTPSAKLAYGFSLGRGETRKKVTWKELLGRETFLASERGLWLAVAEMNVRDKNNYLKTIVIEGEIRLRVLKSPYIPLDKSWEDANFNWIWQNNNRIMKMTPSGRSFVGEQNGR